MPPPPLEVVKIKSKHSPSLDSSLSELEVFVYKQKYVVFASSPVYRTELLSQTSLLATAKAASNFWNFPLVSSVQAHGLGNNERMISEREVRSLSFFFLTFYKAELE